MKFSRDYALGWVLLGLFVFFWVGQTVVGWQEFLAQQREHGQGAQIFGDSGMVVLTSLLIYKGSPESKDGDEEMKQTLVRLERRLEELAASGAVIDRDSTQTQRIWSVSRRAAVD